MFKPIEYKTLNARQKENFNFQKVAAELADFGFNCIRLTDDWQGADFIACHIDGNTFIKVQLKGRLTIDKKYNGKDIFVAFCDEGRWYLYPHDQVQKDFLKLGRLSGTSSWDDHGLYTFPSMSRDLSEYMEKFAI